MANPENLKNRITFTGYAMVAGAASLWGCWAFFLRPAGLAGVASAFVLFCIMALPAPLALRGGRSGDRGATRALIVLGIADAANVGLYFEAVRKGPLSVAVLTHYLTPLLVVLAAPWLVGEWRSRRSLVAAPISLLGLLLLVGPPGGEGFSPRTAALGAGSALFYAGVVFASKRAARAYSPLAVTALHAPISGLMLALAFGGRVLPPPDSHWGWAVAGALICGLLATVLFNSGLRRIPAQSASALTYLEPVIASALGWAAFGERLGLRGALGALLVLVCGAWGVAAQQPVAEQPAQAPLP